MLITLLNIILFQWRVKHHSCTSLWWFYFPNIRTYGISLFSRFVWNSSRWLHGKL